MDFLKRHILEDPFYVYFGLALATLGILAAYRHRPSRKFKIALLAAPAVALGVFLASHFVTTERERIVLAMAEVCAAAGEGDMQTFQRHIAPDARVELGRWGQDTQGRDAIVSAARSAVGRYDVRSVKLTSAEVEFTGEKIATMRAVTRIERQGGQIQALTWKIDWIQRQGQWMIYDVYPPGFAGLLQQF